MIQAMIRSKSPLPAPYAVYATYLCFATVLFLAGPDGLRAAPPAIAGCPILPPDNIWNTEITKAPVHPRSRAYVASIGRDRTMHPDFGSGEWPPGSGAPIGIPFAVVDANTPRRTLQFRYAAESDPGPYPLPADPPIEGGPRATKGDRHVLLLDKSACKLYEIFAFEKGRLRAGSGAIFDLRSNALRPDGWTSADAAGLPILPGLVRYEEAAAGEINHALRFTAPRTQRAYVWPATHFASRHRDPGLPPLGTRFRLRANYDTSGFGPRARAIVRAMQRYGLILADNGSPWFLSGAPHASWDNKELRQLKRLRGRDFEAVDVSGYMLRKDSGQARLP